MEKGKSSEMPLPRVMNYMQFYEVSDMFINDLHKVLGDLPYVDAQKFFDKIEKNKRIMSAAAVNEFCRDLAALPYKIVAKLMLVINNTENFVKYFVPCNDEQIKQIIENENKKSEQNSSDK